MNLAVVINTCALGKDAARRSSKGHGVAYAARARILNDTILPSLRADPRVSEIIVAGEWVSGEGYRYIHAPGPDANVWDQCVQKHAAAEASDASIFVFLCDDHLLAPDFTERIERHWWTNQLWDILSPNRCKGGRALATGWDEGYIHAHTIVMRRRAVEKVSWDAVFHAVRGTWGWDVPATRLWDFNRLRIATDPDLFVIDIEDNPTT